MRRILDRYILKEIALTWVAVTAVLLLILLTNQFARVLGNVAKGNLPKDAAMQVIGLSAVQYLTVLIPISLFLSIMMALGRLYRDSEMAAMTACRVGPMGVYRPLLWLALPLVAAVAWLSIEIGPSALQQVDTIGAEARRQIDLSSIEPGRFTEVGPENAVVYGEKVSADGVMENVFMQRQGEDGRVEVVIAKSGEQVATDDPDTRMLLLHDGRRYEGVPGTTGFRVLEFEEHGIPYRLPGLEAADPAPRAMPFVTLLESSDPLEIAELQWRLSIPLSTLLLGLLAVPLSKSQPREGRYGRIAIGLLVFIIYLNMLSAAKAWIESGEISPGLGLWWVHGAVLLLTVLLLAAQNGVHRRLFR
ncbi:MAG TPA: LPS export ABC transporter permease LptF [Woeseiaceae bacterium]|nr:LPS export ABC transporter permease LptF [Woeseiaceae bacterium]